jgi:NAD(P)-dependent dehydrogenase (short-subunit alcohol dehydrogenase family)
MSDAMPWLEGKRALVVGAGAAVDAVAEALAAHGADVAKLPAAIDELAVTALLAEAQAQLKGSVDLLVHAGVTPRAQPALDMRMNDWRANVSADLDSRFLTMAAFARQRIAAQAPGSVLLLMAPAGSVDAGAGTINGTLENLVKSLAVEWARDGIRVNAIASRHAMPGGSDAVALQSLGHLAAYMLSDYGAYITGTTSGVDELPAA